MRRSRWRVPCAKTVAPHRPADFVPRPRVLAALEDAAQSPVTIVRAPAGYGKTLALADWARSVADVAWVSLDGDDDEPGRFWAAVLTAIAGCAWVPPQSALRRLGPPDETDYPGFLAEVLDALDALPAPVRLVLDDVHAVTGPRTRHGIITLIRYRPRGLRLVLSSRFDPDLPLARLHVQGGLAEIRADRLKFSADEASALLHAAGVDLDGAELRLLLRRTDGWAGVLRLAALALRQAPDHGAYLADFVAEDPAVADYLVGEVLAGLPEHAEELLRVLSVCDEVCPSLAQALSERENAGALLGLIDRETSLVTRRGGDQRWYRTNVLLRSFLRADLDRSRPATAAALHRTAATWFRREGRIADALHHAERARDGAMVAELLHRDAAVLALMGEGDELRHALGVVGADAVSDDARLALTSALAYLQAGELTASEGSLARAVATWPACEDGELMILRGLIESNVARARGVPVAAPPDEPVPAPAQDGGLACWVRLERAWALLSAGRPGQARRELREVGSIVRGNGFDYLAVQYLTVLGLVSALDGVHDAMEASCAEAVGIAERQGWKRPPGLALDQLLLAFGALMRLEPDSARRRAQLARAALPRGAAPVLETAIDFLEGAAAFDSGDRDGGVARMRRGRRQLGGTVLPPALIAVMATVLHRAALSVNQDSLARETLAWAEAVLPATAELAVMTAWTEFAADHPGAAGTALRAAIDGSAGALLPSTEVDARLLETALALRADQRTKARRSLDTALALARPQGLLRPFSELNSPVWRLLVGQLGSFGASEGFARRMCDAVTGLDAVAPGVLLTEREKDVLARLPAQRSLEEIAADLTVSVNTVKTHVRAIYAKLGVNNRRAAVVAAREIGLAPAVTDER